MIDIPQSSPPTTHWAKCCLPLLILSMACGSADVPDLGGDDSPSTTSVATATQAPATNIATATQATATEGNQETGTHAPTDTLPAPTDPPVPTQPQVTPCTDQDGDGSCLAFDCDDGNANAYPGNFEACDGIDNNCNGTADEGYDQDGDGYISCAIIGIPRDCDDTNSAINPGATEVCNTVDDNCNSQIDEGLTSPWYPDSDGDNYGASTGAIQACSQPLGYAAVSGDCDDSNGDTYPGATELCDGIDNDCDASVSDESPLYTFYIDQDDDGYGDTSVTIRACAPPDGYSEIGGDCDDNNRLSYPTATEVCDGGDNDCDLLIDEGLEGIVYVDDDHDGYGDPEQPIESCGQCTSCVLDNTDCDDTDGSVYPDAPELQDGKDNNCDGEGESEISLSSAPIIISGTTAAGQLGYAVSPVGDTNGDGYDDFAVGAPRAGISQAGVVYVFNGRSNPSDMYDTNATAALTIDKPGSEMGTAITGGDIDNDGFSDVIVGAPKYDIAAFSDSGIVFISPGSSEGILGETLSQSTPRSSYIAGSTTDVNMGTSLDAQGDINGDSIDDLLIGAPWPWLTQVPPVAGITFILPGKTGKYTTAGGISAPNLVQVYGESNQITGLTVRHVGNLNGDSYGDLLTVGYGKSGSITNSISNAGITYALRGDSSSVYTPGTTSLLNVSTLTLGSYTGDTEGDIVGKWAEGLGDVNSDGYDDFILGRQNSKTGEPLAMLYLGGQLPASGNAESNPSVAINTNDSSLRCPCSVGDVGDFDGDGINDFAVAATGSSNGGTIFIFYGQEGGWPFSLTAEDDANLTFVAENPGDQAGYAITSLGDINLDAKDDFAISAIGADVDGRADAGKLYIFLGL